MKKYILSELIFSLLNTPYKWGGNHPLEGFDCSGFILWLLTSIDAYNNHDTTAQGLYNHFEIRYPMHMIDIRVDDFMFGDLIFFGDTNVDITHIAMALDDDLMVEAGGGDSSTTSLRRAKKKGACVRIRPITSRMDLIAAFTLPHLLDSSVLEES